MKRGTSLLLGDVTLLAARGGEKVKYDWLTMMLYFVLVCCTPCLYAVAWWLMSGAEYGFSYC